MDHENIIPSSFLAFLLIFSILFYYIFWKMIGSFTKLCWVLDWMGGWLNDWLGRWLQRLYNSLLVLRISSPLLDFIWRFFVLGRVLCWLGAYFAFLLEFEFEFLVSPYPVIAGPCISPLFDLIC
jgi:hypothetical protein